ncbi:hypothetical protein PCASD_16785 [Puccinia coronata f. sp. avenae]|uniref:BED-type domain-containing protein n=1 Tax=Puccinia coronata f. sp. avenae TaxID=200324 RepID=A0A2N5TVI8_9BASI|nr:hypothetical protein PCASD_16785 [Puccinia coronata f. sp. avenae]
MASRQSSRRQPPPPSSPSNQGAGKEPSSAKEKVTDTVTSKPQTPDSPLPPHNSHSSNSDLAITGFVKKNKDADTYPASLNSKPKGTAKSTDENKSNQIIAHTTKKRKPTSQVWEHFHQKGTGRNIKAICKYCATQMTGKSSNGTNHLHCHLVRCSSFHFKSKQTLLKLADTSSSVLTWAFSQEASCDLL